MNRIKNIIFDLGGVLLDLDVNRCMERFEEVGLHEVRQWMTGTNEKGFFKEYECGTLTTDQFRDRICKEVGRELPGEEIDQIWNAMLKDIPDYKFELLLKLQENYKLYLLSNTNDLHWEHCADKFVYKGMQMLGCFTRVFLSYQMHLAKPDAEIFRTVLKEAGIKAEETLFVDDSKDNYQAASLLGIKVFHYVPGDNLEIQLQNFISK